MVREKREPKGEQERRRIEGEGEKKEKCGMQKEMVRKKGATIGGAGEGKGRGVRGE